MAHLIDMTTGRASMAYRGEKPWHGLGQALPNGGSIGDWQKAAGLEWTAEKSVASYITQQGVREADGVNILYRSDTLAALGTVSDRYQVVQPAAVLEFYRDLTEQFGFDLETAGAIKGGKVIWALAKTGQQARVRGSDVVNGYVLLSTSFDGSLATNARFTSVRVVCNNTLTIANRGKAGFSVSHATAFNPDKAKEALGIGAWADFEANADKLASKPVDTKTAVQFFLEVYRDITADKTENLSERAKSNAESLVARLANAYLNGPGAEMASAKGTAWGLVNAVTHDIDFNTPARSRDNRLASAWFGAGEAIKNRAWEKALALAA